MYSVCRTNHIPSFVDALTYIRSIDIQIIGSTNIMSTKEEKNRFPIQAISYTVEILLFSFIRNKTVSCSCKRRLHQAQITQKWMPHSFLERMCTLRTYWTCV
jgi:hypothetical protein